LENKFTARPTQTNFGLPMMANEKEAALRWVAAPKSLLMKKQAVLYVYD
jgi:hypothetical protein